MRSLSCPMTHCGRRVREQLRRHPEAHGGARPDGGMSSQAWDTKGHYQVEKRGQASQGKGHAEQGPGGWLALRHYRNVWQVGREKAVKLGG